MYKPEDVIKLTKDYFRVFIEEVIGLQNASFHDELDDIISNPLYKSIVYALPRGTGKSTHLSVAYPLWELALNHNLLFMLVSSTSTVASNFITQILNHIENNEKYRQWSKWVDPEGKGVIPKIRSVARREEKWSGAAITIDRSDVNLKDPTIQAIGVFGSVLSRRANRIIGDDIVTQENSMTKEQRDKIKDWMDTTVLPCLTPDGRFVYLGNTWDVDDLVMRYLADPKFDFRKRMPSIIKDPDNQELWQEWAKIRLNEELTFEDKMKKSEEFYILNKEEMEKGMKLLWPEKFNYKMLYLERMSSPYSFARMRQCDPASRPDQKIKEEWIQLAINKGKNLRLQAEPRERYTISICSAGMDLAIGEKKTNDDNCLTVLDRILYGDETIKAGDIVIRNQMSGKWSPNQTKEKIKLSYFTSHWPSIRVESNAYQMAIARDLEEDKDFTVPVTAYITGGEKNDPEMGVNSIANLMEQGKFVIPWDTSDPRTMTEMSKLINDLRNWPTGHTGDKLMGLWHAFSEMRDKVAKRIVIPESEIPSLGIPYKDLNPADVKVEEYNADKEIIKESNEQRQRGKFVF